MTEPTTAAGRALLAEYRHQWGQEGTLLAAQGLILAIEAEARQQDGSVLRAALERNMVLVALVNALAALPPSAPLPRTYIERIHDAKDRLLAEHLPSAPPALDEKEVLRLLRLVERDYDDGLTEPESEAMIRDVRAIHARLQEPER